MIDYDTPDEDPIVAEVRRAREEYAARFNYDLDAMFDDLKKRETSNGRKYVTVSQPLVPSKVDKKGTAA